MNNVLLYTYVHTVSSPFIHWLNYLSCSHILAVVNNTAINMIAGIFSMFCFAFLWIYTEEWDSWIILFKKFLATSILFSVVDKSIYIPPTVHRSSLFHILTNTSRIILVTASLTGFGGSHGESVTISWPKRWPGQSGAPSHLQVLGMYPPPTVPTAMRNAGLKARCGWDTFGQYTWLNPGKACVWTVRFCLVGAEIYLSLWPLTSLMRKFLCLLHLPTFQAQVVCFFFLRLFTLCVWGPV